MSRTPAPDARDRILAAAARLFDAHGVHAVGLQQIIDDLGCGKNFLYREFPTKDDLVVAYLRRCRQEWESIIEQARRPHEADQAGQLVAIVNAIAEQATRPRYRVPGPVTPR